MHELVVYSCVLSQCTELVNNTCGSVPDAFVWCTCCAANLPHLPHPKPPSPPTHTHTYVYFSFQPCPDQQVAHRDGFCKLLLLFFWPSSAVRTCSADPLSSSNIVGARNISNFSITEINLFIYQCLISLYIYFCLSNRKFERLGDPLDEIVTISVHKYSVIMPRHNVMWWRHLIRETRC